LLKTLYRKDEFEEEEGRSIFLLRVGLFICIILPKTGKLVSARLKISLAAYGFGKCVTTQKILLYLYNAVCWEIMAKFLCEKSR
jgi:hypothetical protein